VTTFRNAKKTGMPQYFDNYKFNQGFTSMMNSFFVDIIKRLYAAMQKHTLNIKVSFDGNSNLELSELV
jgi:hypothetical protein